MLSYSDQIETLHEACINWLRKNSNISDYQRAQVNFYFAYACSLIGDFKQAEIALEESLSIAHYLKNIKLVIHTYVIQTWVLLIAGKPKLANKTLNNALASEHFDSGYQSLLMLSMAETSRQLGKIDYDLNHLLMLKNIAKQTNNTAYGFACFYATISKYLWLSGKYIEATQTLKNDQKELIAAENSALSNSVLIDELIRQLLFNKELDEATLQKNLLLEFITKYPNSDKIATQYIQEHLDMIDTRLYLFKKNHKKSLDLLTPLIEQATAQERNNRLVQLLIMQAWAYQQATQEKQALASLKQAFAISIPNGIIMVYIEEGYAIKALIKKCITLIIEKETNDIFKQYQQALLNVLAIDLIPESPKTALETPTKNLLTQKEREILKLLNSLDSLKVVADKAQITYMTLRWHTKNIYRKLEVYRRADAVEKVKQLKLI